MHYAVGAHTIVELHGLYLPMNALSRIVEIGRTVSEMRADCLYLAGKGVDLSTKPPPMLFKSAFHPQV